MKSRLIWTLLSAIVAMLLAPQAAAQSSSNAWQFAIAPYLWAAGMDGTMTIGNQDQDIDVPFSDIIENLDLAFMGHFDMRNERWVLSSDLIFVDLESTEDANRGTVTAGVDMTLLGCHPAPFKCLLAAAFDAEGDRKVIAPCFLICLDIRELVKQEQIAYEYKVLEALAESGVTPRPIACHPHPEPLGGGALLMAYLPGDNIVLVITASAHREAAFEATRFLMDYLKSRAPFWKKELGADGQTWVDAKDTDEDALKRW